MKTENDDYKSLSDVLARAYAQASIGKGSERHASGQPFEAQPMQTISQLLESGDGLLFQAIKKIHESKRLPLDRGVAELLGAINYIAGAIIFRENKKADNSSMLRRESDREYLERLPVCNCGMVPCDACIHGASCSDG